MPSFLPIELEASVNVVRAAAPLFMAGYSDLTKRNHVLLNMMGELGTVEYNATDLARTWKILVREPRTRTFQNTTNKTFGDHNSLEELQVGIRGYEADDSLKELDYKLNMGETRLINLLDLKLKQMGSSMRKQISEGLYLDGDLAVNKDGYQGFESALGCENSNRGGTDPTNNDAIVLPSDTYGGHSTALGYFGGTCSADIASGDRLNQGQGEANDFPYGKATVDYDAMSPTLWNYTAEKWGSGSNLWVDNCEEVVRESLNVLHSRTGIDPGARIVYVIANDLYPGLENHFGDRFRLGQTASGDNGFPEHQTLKIDGCTFKSDAGCPAGVGYGFVANHMEMFNLITMYGGGEEPMIDCFGPTWEDAMGAFIMRCSTFGNLRLQPKFMTKLAPLSHYVAQSAA